MKSDAQKFIDSLDGAVHLLETHPIAQLKVVPSTLEHTPPEKFDLALFDQWPELCAPIARKRSPVRIVQHLSCTGGTIISKCLSAMPNVSLLSEVNPLSPMDDVHRSGFAPTDLTYLAKQIQFPLIDELSQKIFKADIDVIAEHAEQIGRYLVLREHSHSNFHNGEPPHESKNIRTLLESEHAIHALVTVRHPLDSYLSMALNNWLQFTPTSFDEYCRRYLLFLEDCQGVPVFKYEDFVEDTHEHMKQLCDALSLPFNEDFQDVFDIHRLSGDSGRASSTIEKRPRRTVSEKLAKEINESNLYLKLCEQLEYDPSIVVQDSTLSTPEVE